MRDTHLLFSFLVSLVRGETRISTGMVGVATELKSKLVPSCCSGVPILNEVLKGLQGKIFFEKKLLLGNVPFFLNNFRDFSYCLPSSELWINDFRKTCVKQ